MRKGLFIGNNYVGTSAELPDCVMDAKSMQEAVKANVSIVMQDCSFGSFKEHLDMLNLTKSDILYLSFSGHGSADGDAHFLVFTDNKKLEFVSNDVFDALLNRYNCSKVIIIDACYSGGVISRSVENTMPRSIGLDMADTFIEAPAPSRLVSGEVVEISASSPTQTALSTGKGGLFTLGLLSSIKTKNYSISVKTAFNKSVKYCSRAQTPQIRISTWNPQLFYNPLKRK